MHDQYTQIPLIATEKRCSKCRETKSVAAFSRDPQHVSGYDAYCRACRKAMRIKPDVAQRRAERATKHAAMDALNAQGLKHCSTCHEVKALTDFNKHPLTHDGLQPSCNACRKPQGREYRGRDPERHQSYRRAYYEANREQILAQNAAYAKEHVDEIAVKQLTRGRIYRQTHREATNTRLRAYHHAHPERQAATDARRRARLKNAPINDFTLQQWEEMKQRHDQRCAYCGYLPKRLTQDHVIPLSRGGSHTASNIVPACLSCNSSKHTKTPEEWNGPHARSESTNPP